jgi:hypothetical protein
MDKEGEHSQYQSLPVEDPPYVRRFGQDGQIVYNPAIALGIPEVTRSDPAVVEFLTLYTRAEELGQAFAMAHTEHLHRRPWFGNPHERLAQNRDALGAPDMRRSLTDRYHMAELLLRALQAVLYEDVGVHAEDPQPRAYVAAKVDEALAPLGYHVSTTEPASHT